MSELEVGAARLGWEVTGEPGDDGRYPVEKDGQAGVLTVFPLDGTKDDPNVARAARCASWARVTHEALREAVAGLLSAMPIDDLTVEDPPLEDVMRQLFSERKPEAGEAA